MNAIENDNEIKTILGIKIAEDKELTDILQQCNSQSFLLQVLTVLTQYKVNQCNPSNTSSSEANDVMSDMLNHFTEDCNVMSMPNVFFEEKESRSNFLSSFNELSAQEQRKNRNEDYAYGNNQVIFSSEYSSMVRNIFKEDCAKEETGGVEKKDNEPQLQQQEQLKKNSNMIEYELVQQPKGGNPKKNKGNKYRPQQQQQQQYMNQGQGQGQQGQYINQYQYGQGNQIHYQNQSNQEYQGQGQGQYQNQYQYGQGNQNQSQSMQGGSVNNNNNQIQNNNQAQSHNQNQNQEQKPKKKNNNNNPKKKGNKNNNNNQGNQGNY